VKLDREQMNMVNLGCAEAPVSLAGRKNIRQNNQGSRQAKE